MMRYGSRGIVKQAFVSRTMLCPAAERLFGWLTESRTIPCLTPLIAAGILPSYPGPPLFSIFSGGYCMTRKSACYTRKVS